MKSSGEGLVWVCTAHAVTIVHGNWAPMEQRATELKA